MIKKVTRISLYVASILTLVISGLSQPVFANSLPTYEDFMSSNNIKWYNGSEVVPCSSVGSTIITTGENPADVYNFLVTTNFPKNQDRPMTPVQAAGVLGNFQIESGFDPEALNPGSGAFGLAQWLGGRKSELIKFANSKNKPETDFELQLQFMEHELSGWEGENLFGDNGTPGDRISTEGFANATTPQAAAYRFDKKYERSEGDKVKERQDAAVQFFNKYAGDGSGVTGGFTGPTSQVACAGGGASGGFEGDFIIFQQCGNSWSNLSYSASTMCQLGCGPTAAANIVANFKADPSLTPDVLAREARASGAEHPTLGSSTSKLAAMIQDKYGFRNEMIASGMSPFSINSYKLEVKKKINESIDNGAVVLVSGKEFYKPFWGNSGHIFVIVGRSDDGKWIIVDSSSPNAKDGKGPKGGDLYDQTSIMQGLHHGAYAIYKQ